MSNGNVHVQSKRLDTIGWALFFIWVGLAVILDLPWGIGLIGVGVITLAMQFIRKSLGLAFERFWILVGLCFLLGGIWDLFTIELPIGPIVFIFVGVLLLVSALRGRKEKGE